MRAILYDAVKNASSIMLQDESRDDYMGVSVFDTLYRDVMCEYSQSRTDIVVRGYPAPVTVDYELGERGCPGSVSQKLSR